MAFARAATPFFRSSCAISLKIQLSSLLTSSWNCVNSFTSGFRAEYSVGVEPLLRSAMTPEANWSASCIALISLMPRRKFW